MTLCRTLGVVLVLAPLAGCTAEDPAATTTEEIGCLHLGCGNTGFLGIYPFYEMDERGLEWSPGSRLRIAKFLNASNDAMQVVVDGARLWGVKLGDDTKVENFNLAGSTLWIESQLTTSVFEVTIEAVGAIYYMEDGDDGSEIQTYRISYVEHLKGGKRRARKALCGTDEHSLPKDAVIFQGDRYDIDKGIVTATGSAAGTWFNIGCFDDAMWKMVIFHYTESGSYGGYTTQPAERTAMLRAIRADYCGTGEPNTSFGVLLEFENDHHWLAIDPDPQPEAVWGEAGAICLDEPRQVDRGSLPCAAELPYCDEVDWSDWQSYSKDATVITWAWTDNP